ncbi:MAG: hypothetical protein HFJ84_01195 [Clostridiales bacterium]|nr:hypothetical protein [Clostridiales bacterium]
MKQPQVTNCRKALLSMLKRMDKPEDLKRVYRLAAYLYIYKTTEKKG